MKRCPKCCEEKVESSFSKDSSTFSGLSTWCRDCVKIKNRSVYLKDRERRLALAKENYDAVKTKEKNQTWYKKNKKKAVQQANAWAKNNIEKHRKNRRRSYRADPDKFRERQRIYAKKHPEIFRAKTSLRRERVRQATPAWVDLFEIGVFYEEARRLTTLTGVPHHVDHEVPLTHPLVCGLHVPWNLRVVTEAENLAKHNRFDPA